MSRVGSLPRLNVHKVDNNNPKRRTAALGALPDMQTRAHLFHNGTPLLAIKEHLPTIPVAEHARHSSLLAVPVSLATVPLLPIVNLFSQQKKVTAHTTSTEPQAARPDGLPPELGSERSRELVSKPAPHYAIPQDRTPLWSERQRPGRFSTPDNPYRQNLDIAPKLKQGANKLSSPAQYDRASELVPAMLPLNSSKSRSPRQGAAQGLEARHLAPLTPADLTPAGSLKQASTMKRY